MMNNEIHKLGDIPVADMCMAMSLLASDQPFYMTDQGTNVTGGQEIR
jgi:hypothetical protein